ncbi:MAG: hypothetical protein ACJAZ3_000892 [Sphingobacteriales bacterium]|jgi:hypothetical protein
MKSLPILILSILISTTAYSQDSIKLWKVEEISSLVFNQSSFLNWAAGGENALSFAALIDFSAIRETKKSKWNNTVNLAYGVQRSEQEFFPTRKNQDRIELNSAYGFKTNNKNTTIEALGNFKSQFIDGYKFTDTSRVSVSNFLAPGYVLLSVGVGQIITEGVHAYLSPATGKITIVKDQFLADKGAYGVDTGANIRYELGAYFTLNIKRNILENVAFSSRLDLFASYQNFNGIDANWEAGLNFQVNKLLSATVATTLIYDEDIIITDKDGLNPAPRVQFREIFGLSLTYKLSN